MSPRQLIEREIADLEQQRTTALRAHASLGVEIEVAGRTLAALRRVLDGLSGQATADPVVQLVPIGEPVIVPPTGEFFCRWCSTSKPIAEFHPDRTKKGHKNKCKECCRKYQAEYSRKHYEKKASAQPEPEPVPEEPEPEEPAQSATYDPVKLALGNADPETARRLATEMRHDLARRIATILARKSMQLSSLVFVLRVEMKDQRIPHPQVLSTLTANRNWFELDQVSKRWSVTLSGREAFGLPAPAAETGGAS